MVTNLRHEILVETVRRWVEIVVVDLNLCPFAKRELVKHRIRFAVTTAVTEEQLLAALQTELTHLTRSETDETTLLIHPYVLQDFIQYNQFLSRADHLLTELQLQGTIQIASFHPDYQFAGTKPDDVENYTNRSPFPLLHLLREASLARSIASHPDTYGIPESNIKLMKRLGINKMRALLRATFADRE